MPVSVEDADECQNCDDASAQEKVSMTIGGQPVGWVFVCSECADELSGSNADSQEDNDAPL